MGRIENGDAFGLQSGDLLEQDFGLAAGEDRRRLVHDEDARLAGERLGDLDHLLLRNRELGDWQARVDGRRQLVQELARLGAHGLPVEKQPLLQLAAEKDIRLGRELLGEIEFLMDEDDALVFGFLAGCEGDRLAAKQDIAARRRLITGQALHQRGFAGAVLANQRMHLAGPQCEVDTVQNLDRAIALAK